MQYAAGKYKIEHIFGGGYTFLDFLAEIDALSQDVSNRLQGIVLTHGYNDSCFDIRRTEEVNILIDENFLTDTTNKRCIIDKNYSRDSLFTELSKRQYDIIPNTGTTKQQMIDWIIENSEQLTNKLVSKYATVCYSEKIEQHIKELKMLLNELDARHTYRAERVLLTDFYYELEDEKNAEEEDIDTIVNKITEEWKTQPSRKQKKTALLLCVFGGYFGLHYFYVGKIGTGILYLCTVGIFGIGWIVDIIKVAAGKFKDKYGYCLK